uniref:RING-type E3 ubiquitin transferase n=1 Tax=Strigops habroptila TaxID=2489341 RepID=A0A672UFU4_STRHB
MEQWHRVAREQEPEPDVPCAICMNGITDAAYVDGCLHSFCFGCIRRWAARRAVCPLCRRPFDRALWGMLSSLPTSPFQPWGRDVL